LKFSRLFAQDQDQDFIFCPLGASSCRLCHWNLAHQEWRTSCKNKTTLFKTKIKTSTRKY